MKAKKHFGQNFLTSIPARIKIVDAGEVNRGDVVVEIGPGTGFLTEELLSRGATVFAVEKDKDLIPVLEEKFHDAIASGALQILLEDVLLFAPEQYPLLKKGYKVIANIPYYITGAIFEHFLSRTYKPTTMVVLIQKEVAERIVKRNSKSSILSLSIEVYGTPRFVTKVVKGSFHPSPSVDSAVLAITAISNNNFKDAYHEDMFFKVVKQGFLHKRKLLISNLRELFSREHLEGAFVSLSLPLNARAEDLSLSDWLRLTKYIIGKK
jgi:16S rRNA (adenine1518-N6/adenine1519-N6)-dimethyltransferase